MGCSPRCVACCTLRFPYSAMEEAYVARRRADVQHIARLWCGVQFALCLLWFFATTTRYRLFSQPSWEAFALAPVPFLAIAVVLASHIVSRLRRYTHILIIASPLVIIGFVAWRVHFFVRQETLLAELYTLNLAFQGLQGNEAALAQLATYVSVEMSRKTLITSGIQMLVQFTVLQFLGLDFGTALLCFSYPVSLSISAYCSPLMGHVSLEGIFFAVTIALILLLSSLQVSRIQRQHFATDRELQVSLEREAEALQRLADHEKRTRETAVEADSILNHMLKNIMADAAGLIWLHTANVSANSIPSDLQQALGCLDRGMQWCRRRQALVRIAAGAYRLSRLPVDLREFGEALATGREVSCHFVDDVVLLDPLLCDILLDNALTNALRHGDHTQEPVTFTMTLQPLEDGEAELTFIVRNRAKAGRPQLTPEFVQAALRGQAVPEPGQDHRLSDGLGLQHLFMAAEAHDVRLSLRQDGDVVTLRAALTVQRGTRAASIVLSTATAKSEFGSLRILCLDDSEVARRLLAYTLERHFPSCSVEVFGGSAQDVQKFMAAAVDRADIVLVDNHLVYDDVQFVGTQLLRQLFSNGFAGFACVQSANMSPEDQAEYAASG
eukprot:EG_transcript_7213